jgi:hypothetical protein
MKSFTVRLPEPLLKELEAESRARQISKSDLVRERLKRPRNAKPIPELRAIADLIGSVEGLPRDLSARKKHHLRESGYGRARRR